MPFSAASAQVSVGARITGTIPAPGNVPSDDNPIADPTTGAKVGAAQTLDFGIGSGQFDTPCAGTYRLAAAGSIELNLFSGGATNSDLRTLFRTAANLRRVKSLVVAIVSGGGTSGVRIGGAASNAWVGYFGAANDTVDIFPGGPPFVVGSPAGKAVTSSSRQLLITNLSSSAEVVVQVECAGCSTAAGVPVGWLMFWTHP